MAASGAPQPRSCARREGRPRALPRSDRGDGHRAGAGDARTRSRMAARHLGGGRSGGAPWREGRDRGSGRWSGRRDGWRPHESGQACACARRGLPAGRGPTGVDCANALLRRSAGPDLTATGAVLHLAVQRHDRPGVRGLAAALLGFFLLPWTTLAYTVMWDVGTRDVNGFEWFIVALAFLADLGAYAAAVAIAPPATDAQAGLRREIRELGGLLGRTLVRQEGQELLDQVERIRHLIRADRDSAAALLAEVEASEAIKLVRAFTTYFHLANVAEQVHRGRELAGIRAATEAGSRRPSTASRPPRFRARRLRPRCGGSACGRCSPPTRRRPPAERCSTSCARSRSCSTAPDPRVTTPAQRTSTCMAERRSCNREARRRR